MFSRQLLASARAARMNVLGQVRYNSTKSASAAAASAKSSVSSYVSKASNLASSITSKSIGYFNCTVYWTKVTAELAKQVYLKEGLAPPNWAQFKDGWKSIYGTTLSSLQKVSSNPQLLRETVAKTSKNDYIQYGAYLVQFAGAFALGEIIGRRHIYGYKSYGHHH